MQKSPAEIALNIVNHITAMVAYWDHEQRCQFSNTAFHEWFGRSTEEILGISMQELLGSMYELNLPHILGALRGEKQVFERRLRLPDGGYRDAMTTYFPDIVDGKVVGFFVHVADTTQLRQQEKSLAQTSRERDAALAEIKTLRGLLPICGKCKSIRDADGNWSSLEEFVSSRTDARFSHGICPTCMSTHYPDFTRPSGEQ